MSDVPYDPSGRIQATAHSSYAQMAARPGSPGSHRPPERSGGVSGVGIGGIFYGLLHVGLCGILLVAGSALASMLGAAIDEAQADIAAQQGVDGQTTAEQQAAADAASSMINAVLGMAVVMGVIGVIYGLVAILGSIGVLMRKTWGRIITIIYGFFSTIQGLLGGFSVTMAVINAMGEDVQVDAVSLAINIAITFFFLAWGLLAIVVLFKSGEEFAGG